MTFHPFKKGLLLNLAKNDQVQNDATMKQTLTIKFFIVAYLFFKVGKYVPFIPLNGSIMINYCSFNLFFCI